MLASNLSRIARSAASAIATLFLVASAPAAAQTLAFEHFTLIDGTGASPLADAGMIVTDGRITWVGPATAMKKPASATVVDLTDKYVIPGLIDTHVHLGLIADGLTVAASNQTAENVENQLRTFARYGVTAVQSMGTDQDVVMNIRNAQRSGQPNEARVFSAGLGVVFEGGYGGLAGVTKKVSTPAEADAAVAREAARNVDLIKFWLDSELGTMPKMPPEISKAVIDGAHSRDLRAVAHIFYLEDAKRLVGQGIDGFTHSVRDQPIGQELIDGMKQHHTWQVAATLSREKSLFIYGAPAPWLHDPFFTQSVPPETLKVLGSLQHQREVASTAHFREFRGFLQTAKKNLKTLADAGIPYAMGTDAGGPARFPGFSEHVELELMVEAGLTPMQALVAATGSGAKFLKDPDIGTLEPRKWADMVVLDANPLDEIRNSRTISAVYIGGRKVPSIDR